MYPEEYKVAKKAVEFLNEHLDVKLPDDETGYLTMHLERLLQRSEV